MMKPSLAIRAGAKEAYLKTTLFQRSVTHDTFLTDVLAWETKVTAKPDITCLDEPFPTTAPTLPGVLEKHPTLPF